MAKITALVSGEDRDIVSYDHLATACIEHEALDLLSDVQTPTLVMGGQYDPICSMTAQNWMMDKLPNAELKIFENSSHFFLMEEAAKGHGHHGSLVRKERCVKSETQGPGQCPK